MTSNKLDDPIFENMVLDAKDYVEGLERDLNDYDFSQAEKMGLDLKACAIMFLEDPEVRSSNTFIAKMRAKLAEGGSLTTAQLRTVLNIIWVDPIRSAEKPSMQFFSCPSCGPKVRFGTVQQLEAHKQEKHGGASSESPKGDSVLEKKSSIMGLNLEELPDGRYATPSISGLVKDSMTYFMVKRVRKPKFRDRRFNYSLYVTGGEYVEAGTIEVRLLVGDTKELVGEQRVNSPYYAGKGEAELDLVMKSPETYALLYGRTSQRCSICGKSLTDDTSRAIGLGLECEKKHAYFTTKPKSHRCACPRCGDDRGKVVRVARQSNSTKIVRTDYACRNGHEYSLDMSTGEVTPST